MLFTPLSRPPWVEPASRGPRSPTVLQQENNCEGVDLGCSHNLKTNDTGGGRVFSLDATSGLLATAGAIGAGAVLVLSAQPLWCELYDGKNKTKIADCEYKPL